MTGSLTLPSLERTRPVVWVLVAAVAGAILDLTLAIAWWLPLGIPPTRVLQSIPAGWGLGRAAYEGGIATASLGIMLYAARSLFIAGAFVACSRHFSRLRDQAWRSGALLGVAVYAVNRWVVLPLFGTMHPIDAPAWEVACVLAHAVLIGLPISLANRHVV